GKETVSVDIRLLAATNQDLEEDVAARKFRQDLYFRLNVVRMDLPSLASRGSDIGLLASHFLERFCTANGASPKRLAAESLELMMAYPWPGNVRELEHLMESVSLMADGDVVTPAHLPAHMRRPSAGAAVPPQVPAAGADDGATWDRRVQLFERALLEDAL